MSTKPAADKDSVQFGRIPYEMICAGVTKGMSRGAARVYLAIAAHANAEWVCRLSLPRLEELTGLSRPGVIISIECLEKIGAIDVQRGGGRGIANQFRVETNSQAYLTLLQPKESSPLNPLDARKGQVSEPKQSSFGGKTVKFRGLNSQAHLTPTDKNSVEQQQQTGAAAGDDELNSEIIEALRAAGIGNPARSRLAGTPGVTVDLVQGEVARLDGKGKGPAILIENIHTAAAKSIAERERAGRDQADTDARRRATGEKLARRAAADASAKEVIDSLADDRLAELQQQVLETCQELKADSWRHADPRECPDLMREIARLAGLRKVRALASC